MSRTINIAIPVPHGLGSNLLALAGLIAVCAGLGGLLGVWVAILAAGVIAVALAYLAQAPAEDQRQTAPVLGTVPTPPAVGRRIS